MKFSYSFSLPSAAPVQPEEELHSYGYSEFTLSLSEDWKQIPTAEEGTFNWYSEREQASITVSADFYEIPESKWEDFAKVNLDGRHRAFESVATGPVSVLNRSVKPYSAGGGLELSYAAHTSETAYLYLGYVTSRKIFNFTLTSGAGRDAAIKLYNMTMQKRLRVKVP